MSILFKNYNKFYAQKLASYFYIYSYFAVLLKVYYCWRSKLPESNLPGEIYIKLTPLFYYPFAIAWNIGDPPRYFGKSDGWITIIPFLNLLIIILGIMYPNEQTIPKSGWLICYEN